MSQPPLLSITHIGAYQFMIDFGGAIPDLAVDEPTPIGAGQGPSPEQLLIAGMTNCLCASLVFALTKYRAGIEGLKAEARCDIGRNEHGRLRIHGVDVAISVRGLARDGGGAERALREFENFCTVSESVKQGIPVTVKVSDENGSVIGPIASGDTHD